VDPVIGSLILSTAIHKHRANTKYKKAKNISQQAVTKVAEAEMRYEEHQKNAMVAYESLCTRIAGIAEWLNGPFAAMFRPFECEDGSYRTDLFGDADIANLTYIKNIYERRQFQQLPAHKKQTGTSAAVTFLLFGWVGEANRQLDTAITQRQISNLVEEQSDTFCMMFDMQQERYLRVYQLLGALNVALIKTSGTAQTALSEIEWLLDENGHIPKDMTAEELRSVVPRNGLNQLTNSINIAKVIMSILKEPIFDENAEITETAQKILSEGEEALKRIQTIRQKGR